MEDFIFEKHDWNSEDSNFINQMQSFFGVNWKQKTAEVCSWMGLTTTDEYINYRDSISNPMFKLGLIQIAEYRNINNANSNCN